MLVSDDTDALEQARFWSTQARDTAPHYQHSEMGYNYRLSNLLAAIGRGQLELLEERVERRRQISQTYMDRLASIPGLQFMPEAPNCRSTRWLSALTIDEEVAGVNANQLLASLEHNNIEARPVWKPLHRQPLFANSTYYPYLKEYSVADQLFSNGICLPSGSSLSDEDLGRVVDTIETCIQNGRTVLNS